MRPDVLARPVRTRGRLVSGSRRPNILLTGRPGIGKTTVIMRLAEHLEEREVVGFYTEEIRDRGRRQGFRAA